MARVARILYIQYTNPASLPPLQHSSRILADAGWDVQFAGVRGIGLERLVFPPHGRIRVRAMPWADPGWRQKVHYLLFCVWVIGLAVWLRPKWVYASDLFSCVPGLLLRALGFRVLYHEHDHPGSPTSRSLRAMGAARRSLARRCPCVLPNEGRAERFRAETGAPHTFVVWNCPSVDEIGPPADGSTDPLWVLYHGSVVPVRLPEAVVRALETLPDRVRLRVIGYETVGSAGYVERLREVAAKANLARRVEFLGPMPRQDLFAWCRKSHVGLALMPDGGGDLNMSHMIGASNKVFDYFCEGMAVLVTDLPDWRAEYVDAGLGLACRPGDRASVAVALRWFADHPAETRAMGEAGRRRVAAEWNYETQFRPVAELIGPPPGRAGERVLGQKAQK